MYSVSQVYLEVNSVSQVYLEMYSVRQVHIPRNVLSKTSII